MHVKSRVEKVSVLVFEVTACSIRPKPEKRALFVVEILMLGLSDLRAAQPTTPSSTGRAVDSKCFLCFNQHKEHVCEVSLKI